MNLKEHKSIPTALLLVVALVWGSTFAIMKDSLDRIDVNSFLAWRFILAAALMAILRPKAFAHINLNFLIRGLLAGLLLGAGYIFQTIGLTETSVAKTGFITGLYAIFVPLIGAAFFKHKISTMQWVAVVIATAGLAILTGHGFSITHGELMVLIGAVFFALHIIALSHWSPDRDPYALTMIQMATVGLLALFSSLRTHFHIPPDHGVWAVVIYSAIFASAFAFIVQTWVQSFMSAVGVGLILTMEYIFAAIFGILLVHEPFTWRIGLGGLCMMTGLYLAILFDQPDPNKSNTVQQNTERAVQ